MGSVMTFIISRIGVPAENRNVMRAPFSRAEQSIADLTASNPETTEILERLSIDYCCKPERSIRQACSEAGIEMDDFFEALGIGVGA